MRMSIVKQGESGGNEKRATVEVARVVLSLFGCYFMRLPLAQGSNFVCPFFFIISKNLVRSSSWM